MGAVLTKIEWHEASSSSTFYTSGDQVRLPANRTSIVVTFDVFEGDEDENIIEMRVVLHGRFKDLNAVGKAAFAALKQRLIRHGEIAAAIASEVEIEVSAPDEPNGD